MRRWGYIDDKIKRGEEEVGKCWITTRSARALGIFFLSHDCNTHEEFCVTMYGSYLPFQKLQTITIGDPSGTFIHSLISPKSQDATSTNTTAQTTPYSDTKANSFESPAKP